MLDPIPYRLIGCALALSAIGLRAGGDEPVSVSIKEPAGDRWMYPANSTPGTRASASTFSALPSPADVTGADDRFGQFVVKFDTVAAGIPAGLGEDSYDVGEIVLTAIIAQSEGMPYDPTQDPLTSYGPEATADPDMGRPMEVHGTGFRGGFTAGTFQEATFGWGPPGSRNAFALGFGAAGAPRDVSNNVTQGFEPDTWAIGQIADLAPGEPVEQYDKVKFSLNLALPGVAAYVRQGLNQGFIWLTLSSLHSATQQGSSGFPGFFTRDHPEQTIYHDVASMLDVEYSQPLRITAFTRDSGGNAFLTWNASPGFEYTVEGTEDLATGIWSQLGTFTTAAPAPLSWSGSSSSPRAFFRIARSLLP